MYLKITTQCMSTQTLIHTHIINIETLAGTYTQMFHINQTQHIQHSRACTCTHTLSRSLSHTHKVMYVDKNMV